MRRRQLLALPVLLSGLNAFGQASSLDKGGAVTIGVPLDGVLREIRAAIGDVIAFVRSNQNLAADSNVADLHRTLLLLAGKKRAFAAFLDVNRDRAPAVANSIEGRQLLQSIAQLTNELSTLLDRVDPNLATRRPRIVMQLSEDVALKQAFVYQQLGSEFSAHSFENASRNLRAYAKSFEAAANELSPFVKAAQ